MKCKKKHYSSICDKATTTLKTTSSCSVTYLVLLNEIEGVKCCALTDTRAGTSCASSILEAQVTKNQSEAKQRKSKLQWTQIQEKLKYILYKNSGNQS